MTAGPRRRRRSRRDTDEVSDGTAGERGTGAAPGRDSGMTTAEYAVGTVAACGFGGILYKVLTSPDVTRMLKDLVERALSVAF